MRVLANDGLDKEGIDVLNNSGIDVDCEKKDSERLLAEIGDYDGLIVRSATKVTKEALEKGIEGKLRVVGRAGVGYDNIDSEYAATIGVVVKNAPHGNSSSTAGLALGFMYAMTRGIVHANEGMHGGRWLKKECRGRDLSNMVLGIIGVGRIGKSLASKARPSVKEILGYDLKEDLESGIVYVTKQELLERADIVSIHVSGKNEIIGETELGLMKQGSYVINCSRGTSVNLTALVGYLMSGKIAGAAMDVHPNEPKQSLSLYESILKGAPHAILTPHIGAETKEAQIATSIEISEVVRDYLIDGDLRNAVNMEDVSMHMDRSGPIYRLMIVNQNVPGVIAKVCQALYSSGVNIDSNSSRPFQGGQVAHTYFTFDSPLDDSLLGQIKNIPEVKRVEPLN